MSARSIVYRLIWMEAGLAMVGALLLTARVSYQRLRWEQVIAPTWYDTALGIAVALTMLLIGIAGAVAAERWHAWAFLKQWLARVAPFLVPLRPSERLVLSLIAGFGEEALFRGAFQPLIGLWLTAFLFAIVHVWQLNKEGLKLMVFYMPFGLLLGWLYAFTSNLWGCCVAHSLYDMMALWWISRHLRNTQYSF